MKMKLFLLVAGVSLALGSGCVTGPNGKKTIDVVKLSQAKAMIEPAAAGALRRVLQNSPEHAPLIARYASSIAGVFCTMSLSNQFSPDFLITEANKFFDPALEKIGDGYVLDAKNAGVGIYRLLWGDRLRAEIPEDQWLHQVCQFFCESINQGLTDAGYPGGVRKSAAIYDLRLTIDAVGREEFAVAVRAVPFPSPQALSLGERELMLARRVAPVTWLPPGYVALARE